MQNLGIFGFQDSLFFSILLRVFKKSIRYSIDLILAIIYPKIILKQFFSSLNLFRAQSFYIHKMVEVIIVCKNKIFIFTIF